MPRRSSSLYIRHLPDTCRFGVTYSLLCIGVLTNVLSLDFHLTAPAEMRLKERRDEPHRGGRKYRSRSRSRSYSNSRQKGVEPYYRGRPNDRRDDSRRRMNNVRPNRSASRSRSPTRSRSASHDGMDNGDEVRKGSRRNDRRDNRAVSRSPAHRRGSLSRSRSGSY
ncbi:FUS-interacting serine-arginine-rich protein 1 [Schistosoma bovis]|uniref:FUS-interacting serine-arginine-rich protein 1 n=1 Tax=Schistosoma bovis TaxID=6184 RepID=A0A430Q508_SCHBO|nr:FUS-interacting serine-arginine-rich protein 1 [Schistosoma bovis]